MTAAAAAGFAVFPDRRSNRHALRGVEGAVELFAP